MGRICRKKEGFKSGMKERVGLCVYVCRSVVATSAALSDSFEFIGAI